MTKYKCSAFLMLTFCVCRQFLHVYYMTFSLVQVYWSYATKCFCTPGKTLHNDIYVVCVVFLLFFFFRTTRMCVHSRERKHLMCIQSIICFLQGNAQTEPIRMLLIYATTNGNCCIMCHRTKWETCHLENKTVKTCMT